MPWNHTISRHFGTPDTIRTCDLQSRSFQAHPDKMLCFQGLCGFYRQHPVSLDFQKTIENTRKTSFFDFFSDRSQTVVTIMWRLPDLPFLRRNCTARKRLAAAHAVTNTRQQSSDCCRVFLYKENHRQCRWFQKALAMHRKNVLLW